MYHYALPMGGGRERTSNRMYTGQNSYKIEEKVEDIAILLIF